MIDIAFSPCPNDTFIFHALVHGLIPNTPEFNVTYADIDITNHWVTNGQGTDVFKISYAALPWALSEYALLPCGGALGSGCGPLLLTNEANMDPDKLSVQKVAVPSERSTAYLLFRLWAAQQIPKVKLDIVVMPFHEIMTAVRDGKVAAGLVIHEARFTYPSYGLSLMVDLGEWWEEDTGLPIPLGAIVARRSLDLKALEKWIRSSVHYAWDHPKASQDYVLQHAQEMNPEIAAAHIQLYVNSYSADLGDGGYQAVRTLLGRSAEESLIPKVDLTSLYY